MSAQNDPQRSAPAGDGPSPADQRRWRNELTRDSMAAREGMRPGLAFPGPGAAAAEDRGAAGKTADTAIKAASVGGQAAGAATEYAGKGIKAIGKGGQAASRGIIKGGAALSGTGVGAIAGVPLIIAGGALSGASSGVQAGGAITEGVGKGMRKAAKGVGKFQKARERGRAMRSMMRGGGGGLPGGGGMPGMALGKGGAMPGGIQGMGGKGALGQARAAMDMASPLGKLKMAKQGLDMAKGALKDPKIRWKLISKGLLGSGGLALVILIILAPLITVAFVIASFAMDFKISGKEWILMAAANAVLASFVLQQMVMYVIVMSLAESIVPGVI